LEPDGEAVKTLTRTVAVECYASRYTGRVLGDIEDSYRRMLEGKIDWAVEH
jgi:hypothetical protein